MSTVNFFLLKFCITSLVLGFFNLDYAASCEYRSKKFLTAVVTGEPLDEVIRWLNRGADINYFGDLGLEEVVKDKYRWRGTALHWAAKHNQAKLIKILLAHDADKAICDSDCREPFRYAQHKKLKKLLHAEPVPKDLTTGLGIKRHINRFEFLPAKWDMGDTSPS